ncbi:TetR/AcrR family transcriptional regulator [Azospirillum sp. B4]|uniref:TetR/AcrR family transcriptional regulator n=1 Tax=Azospirillum sp. B4 TaxID=95605 RepID=UPI0003456903|nr:TetR family transcriptional regulator [Azospirillum sp. B4]
MAGQATRDQIIRCADRLFYENGFEHTSFADIATAVGISRGNFYYHFKTKDEILDAVIARRLDDTQALLARWEAGGATPADRIRSFIHILIANQAQIMLYGCPVGTLSTELAKLGHGAQGQATKLFTLFRDWLARQFTALGRADAADGLALHLLARSQGVATLAQAFRDDAFVRQEVRLLEDWLDARATGA